MIPKIALTEAFNEVVIRAFQMGRPAGMGTVAIATCSKTATSPLESKKMALRCSTRSVELK